MTDPHPPIALAISDGTGRTADELVQWALRLSRAGVDAVQLREKTLTDLQVFHRAQALVAALSATATRVIVNARFDIAIAAKASGVHLPATGISTSEVRRAVPEPFLVGRSTHSLEEISDAFAAGADYVTFGPIFDTPSKRGFGLPQGLAQLRRAAALDGWVVALGGIELDTIDSLAAAGASGFAGIRIFQGATATIEGAVQTMGRRPGKR